jgi:hypothetical protein
VNNTCSCKGYGRKSTSLLNGISTQENAKCVTKNIAKTSVSNKTSTCTLLAKHIPVMNADFSSSHELQYMLLEFFHERFLW